MKQSIKGYDMPVLVEAVAKRRYERDREAIMAAKNWQEFPPTWDEMTPQQRHAIKAQVSTLVTDVVECLPSDEPDEPSDTLYDIARRVTDSTLGAGTYASMNASHPDPGVQAAIARFNEEQA